MKLLTLVALLVAVITVSGRPRLLKDAEKEYLKRAIIRSVKERFEQQIVAAPNDIKTDEDLDAIIPQINADTTSAVDIKEEDASPRCTLSLGETMDKKGSGHQLSMGWVYSNAECVELCLTEQKSNSNITGLSIQRNDLRREPNLHCGCSRGVVEIMYFWQMGNDSYSCIFTPVTADPSKDVQINDIINGDAANSKLVELDAIMLETKDSMQSSTEVVSKDDSSGDALM